MACNITAPLRLLPYSSRWTRLNSRHFVCVLCTSCSMGITLTNCKRKFRRCSPATNDIMQHFFHTSHLLHTAHVVYQLQSKPYSLTSPSAFTFFPKNAASLNPYFPKMLQSKKLTTKISSQTEFTMSRRLSAHNKNSHWYRITSMIFTHGYGHGLN